MDCVNRIFQQQIWRDNPTRREEMTMDLPDFRKLTTYFRNPQNNLKIIHVAGTNGKGTVSLKISRCL